jgi:hypothetical protein
MRINDLSRLRELLSQDEAGLATHVYAQMQFGDMWWIPDEQTGFGRRGRHPWVVLEGYQTSRPTVIICPRTSQIEPPRPGLLMPAGVLDGLDRPGLVLIIPIRVLVYNLHYRHSTC